MSQNPSMAEHPDLVEVQHAHDLVELRARYERAAEAPLGQLLEGLMVVAGLWVAVSGWVVGFAGSLRINDLIVGLALAVLGFSFAVAYGSSHRIAWVGPVLGAWTIAALWAVNGAAMNLGSMLSNIIAGAVILIGGLAILAGGAEGGTRSWLPMSRKPARARSMGRRPG
jgi:hypothetical protein